MDGEGERAPKINAILMLERNKNQLKNCLFFKPKSRKIVKKHSSKNVFFWACTFQSILGGFGKGLGRVLGRVWRVLASLGPLFGVFFWCLYSECSPKGVLEAPGLDFGSILNGLGGVWGGFWEGFRKVWKVQNCIFLGLRFLISCSGCWCFWRGLDRKQDALR